MFFIILRTMCRTVYIRKRLRNYGNRNAHLARIYYLYTNLKEKTAGVRST